MTKHSSSELEELVCIRIAEADDHDGISEVNREIRDDPKSLQRPPDPDLSVGQIEKCCNQVAFVVESESRIIGYLRLVSSGSMLEPVAAELITYMSPSWQGKKIGHALMWFSIAYVITSTKVSELIVHVSDGNAPALSLNEKCGFKRDGNKQKIHSGRHGVKMVRIIER